jgi:hypothetical protein
MMAERAVSCKNSNRPRGSGPQQALRPGALGEPNINTLLEAFYPARPPLWSLSPEPVEVEQLGDFSPGS